MSYRDVILSFLRSENFRLVKVEGCARGFTEADMLSLAGRLASTDCHEERGKILTEAVQKVRDESLEFQI